MAIFGENCARKRPGWWVVWRVIIIQCRICLMALSGKEKKYIKKKIRQESLEEIAKNLKVGIEEVEEYLKNKWGEEKWLAFRGKSQDLSWQGRVRSFSFKTWLLKNQFQLLLICLLVLGFYANSLGNAFVSDDIAGIRDNVLVGNWRHALYSPPAVFWSSTLALITNVFGKTPVYFRLLNIFTHLGTCLTLYLILDLLKKKRVALIAACLVAVHPLLGEAVVWISGGIYSQYAFFCILSLLFWILGEKDKKFYGFSFFALLLGLMSSEKAMAFPFILFGFELAEGRLKRNWKWLIAPFFLVLLWVGIYFGRVGQRIETLETVHYQSVQKMNPLKVVPVAVSSYLELVAWPKGLTLYHTEMHFTRLQFIFRILLFLGFFLFLGLAWMKNRSVFFWGSFFILSLLPVLTPFGISWIVAERYVYLGTIGILTILAMGLDWAMKIKGLKTLAIWGTILLVVVFGFRTALRNQDWKNEDSLWVAAAKYSPSSPQNHNNLGDMYARQGNLEKSAEEFKIAIQQKENYADAWHNLANVYVMMKETDKAIETYLKALEFNPNIWQSHQNVAALYFGQQKYALAEENLKKAIEINPEDSNLYSNLGIVLVQQGKIEEAKKYLQKALEINPQNQKAIEVLSNI